MCLCSIMFMIVHVFQFDEDVVVMVFYSTSFIPQLKKIILLGVLLIVVLVLPEQGGGQL